MPNSIPPIKKAFRKLKDKSSPATQYERMMMGRPDGTLSTTTGKVWVTGFDGQPIEVLNRRVSAAWGTLVNVGYDPVDFPKTKQVLGFADVYITSDWPGPAIPAHASTHDYGGPDCDWVARERILHFAPVANQNKVDLYPYAVATPIGWKTSTAATRIDYSAHIPSSGVRVSLIVLDATKTITFRDGTPKPMRTSITDDDWPALVPGDYAFFGMYLTAGMTYANHQPGNDDFINLTDSGAISGGGSVIGVLSVDEIDGTPSVINVTKIKFQNGSVTDNGDGSATVVTPDAVDGGASGLMTGADKTKLNGIEAGAEVNVNADWNATSGDALILNRPDIPTVSYLITEDLTAQITGSTAHFTLGAPSISLPNVYCNLRQQPASITLDDDRLGFILAFTPTSGDVLIVDYYVLSTNVLTDDAGTLMFDDSGAYMLEV
jgi:hypothetical protein